MAGWLKFFFFFFFLRLSHYVSLAGLELTERSTCLCLLSARIDGVSHRSLAAGPYFKEAKSAGGEASHSMV